jgi:hypothetical protein
MGAPEQQPPHGGVPITEIVTVLFLGLNVVLWVGCASIIALCFDIFLGRNKGAELYPVVVLAMVVVGSVLLLIAILLSRGSRRLPLWFRIVAVIPEATLALLGTILFVQMMWWYVRSFF